VLYAHGRVRDITEQPYFLALVAVIIRVQLFLAGFFWRMVSSPAKRHYLIRDRVGAFPHMARIGDRWATRSVIQPHTTSGLGLSSSSRGRGYAGYLQPPIS